MDFCIFLLYISKSLILKILTNLNLIHADQLKKKSKPGM